MINFICRWCDQPSEIDRFRSKYPNVCLGCYKADITKKNRGANRKFLRLKYTARKRSIPMLLTEAEYTTLIDQPCSYCGSTVEDTGAGLDRMDNSGSYKLSNVVPSCKWCNAIKNDHYSYSEMLQLGETIRNILRERGTSRSSEMLHQPHNRKIG